VEASLWADFRVRRYGYRDGSGGAGQYRGGDGLIREIELLTEAQVTLLAERRKFQPYGLQGGQEGAAGRAWIETASSDQLDLPGKCSRRLSQGDILHIETPGGGGWGKL
jgi:N-methylhydantoinase B